MKNTCLLIVLIVSLHLNGQGFRSRFYIPGTLNHASRAIYETSPGNYIAAGFCTDTVNGVQIGRIALMGLGSEGQLLWIKKYGQPAFSYIDNGFIFRSFYKHKNFLYYTGCIRDTNNRMAGVFIKFDLNGDSVWQKIYRDLDQLEDLIPQKVTASVDGGFLITGFYQNWSNSSYRKCLLIKTDINGNDLWRKKIGKTAPDVADGKSIVQDSASKKILMVGYQYINNYKEFDHVLVVDSLGNNPQQGNYMYPGGLAMDCFQRKNKKMVVCGSQKSSQTVGGEILNEGYAASFDINTPFVPLWTRTSVEKIDYMNNFSAITELGDGTLVLGGHIDTTGLLNLMINYLIRITKIDASGNVLSNRLYSYKTNPADKHNYQMLSSIEPTSDGGLVVAIKQQNLPGNNPFFFVKYDASGCDTALAYCAMIAGGAEHAPASDFEFYPNPAKKEINVQSKLFSGKEKRLLEIRNNMGHLVSTHELPAFETNQVDVSPLTPGLYFLSLTDNGVRGPVKKLVIAD